MNEQNLCIVLSMKEQNYCIVHNEKGTKLLKYTLIMYKTIVLYRHGGIDRKICTVFAGMACMHAW